MGVTVHVSAVGDARRAAAFALAVLIPLGAGPAGAAIAGAAGPPPAASSALLASAASDDAAVDALVALQAEVLVLVELGAFSTVPPSLAAVHETYRSYLTGIDRAGLLSWLQGSDADGANALGRLGGEGVALHDKTAAALSPLPGEAWTALAEGRTLAVAPSVYVAALDQLHNLAEGAPAPGPTDPTSFADTTSSTPAAPNTTVPNAATTIPLGTVPTGTVPSSTAAGGPGSTNPSLPRPGATSSAPPSAGNATVATPTSVSTPAATGSTTARPSTTRPGATGTAAAGATTVRVDGPTDRAASAGTATTAPSDGESGNDRGSTKDGGVPVGLLAALLAVLCAIGVTTALLVASRRRGRPTDELDAVLEAGRQLASVLELAPLYPTMLAQARGLLGAEHAAYLSRGAIVPTADTEGDLGLDAGARVHLDRVAETGQSWLGAVGWHDTVRAPVAVLATAVTGGGQVLGVLVVRRAADRPFQRADQVRLERLAPFVAAALSAATRHQELTDLTFTDALTNLANRRQLDDHVSAAVTAAGATIGFAMIDVDHFKAYNDTHGHPAGDALLRRLAALLAANVRPGDVVYRYGGEEFAILLPGADQGVAAEVGERVRQAVHQADLPGGSTQPNGRVTVSVGIAVGRTEEAELLKGQADQSLYEAKRSGRDRVVVAPTRA